MDKLLFYSLNSKGLPNGPNFNRTAMLGKLSMFKHGGPHDPIYVSSPDDPRYQQYLSDLKNYEQRNIDIQDERSDAIARYNKLEPQIKESRSIDEYLQRVLMLEPLSKPTQEYVYDKTEAAALNAEEAFAKKQALEQELNKGKNQTVKGGNKERC